MSAGASAVLLMQDHGRVRCITFNRPDRRNAWSDELSAAYAVALAEADRDPGVRAIVVAAEGPSFCVGGDMADLKSFAANRTFSRPDIVRSVPWQTTAVRKPVIAAVQGGCAGVGLAHALTCDVRFAAADARFATSYARRGLPAESGTAWLLSRVVGVGAASDLLLSGRVIGAQEALQLGLVNRVVPAGEVVTEALGYAQDIAQSCSPAAMQTIKQQLWEALAEESFEVSATMADQLAERFLAEEDDVAEGVQSFIEKRPPEFGALPSR